MKKKVFLLVALFLAVPYLYPNEVRAFCFLVQCDRNPPLRWNRNNLDVFSAPFGDPDSRFIIDFNQALNEWSGLSNWVFRSFSTSIPTNADDPCGPVGAGRGWSFSSTNCGVAFGITELAVTRTFFNTSTSTITDADIIFNNAFTFTPTFVNPLIDDGPTFTGQRFTDTGSRIFSFRELAIHELGHVLGLDHSQTNEAVMFAFHQATLANQNLRGDDVLGLTTLYGGARVDLALDDFRGTQLGGNRVNLDYTIRNRSNLSSVATRVDISLIQFTEEGRSEVIDTVVSDVPSIDGLDSFDGSFQYIPPTNLPSGTYRVLLDVLPSGNETTTFNNFGAAFPRIEIVVEPDDDDMLTFMPAILAAVQNEAEPSINQPQPPEPEMPSCDFTILQRQGGGSLLSSLNSDDAMSQLREGSFSRFFIFSPESNGQILNGQVTISLTSSDFDTFLAIRDVCDIQATALFTDDDGGSGVNSLIIIPEEQINGDLYIEVTTFFPGEEGSFEIRVD